MGIVKGKMKKEDLLEKMTQICQELGLDIDIFFATTDDYYRKPMTGMWNLFKTFYPKPKKYTDIFYCGDAAGREKDWLSGKKKDHNVSDYNFAYNLQMRFDIPENVFRDAGGKPIPFHVVDMDYLGLDLETLVKKKMPLTFEPYHGHEMIIMLGRPASGKSELALKLLSTEGFKNYVYVNQDICKTKVKCLNKAKDAIKGGKSLIIDNTNPDKNARKDYIKIAREMGQDVYISVYLMDVPEILCKHLNNYRVEKSKGKIKRIPIIAYRVYNKKYQEPSLDEGIDQIIKIPFSFDGKTKEDVKMFLYHYTNA